jgi:hypothetical protein
MGVEENGEKSLGNNIPKSIQAAKGQQHPYLYIARGRC